LLPPELWGETGKSMAKPISQEEWDFSNCSTDEAHECLAWELARESELVITDVKTLRKGVKGETFEAYLDHIGMGIFEGIRGRTMNSFYFCPEFPGQPYLSVSDKERKQRLTKLWGVESEAMSRMLDARNDLLPQDIRRRIANAAKTGEPISCIEGKELVLLQIDWHWPDSQLLKFFKAWLKKNRQTDVEQWPDRGWGVPTTISKNRLKKLGAWRLQQIMSWKDAAFLSQEVCPKGTLYCEQKEWAEAASDVDEWMGQIKCFEAERLSSPSG